ncbi:MAG: DUF1194 domain-containing protein [Rhodospirillaceae bacterium]|nr:DUF1194 domain-containing protein [Rhodospirillaceae bacterium]
MTRAFAIVLALAAALPAGASVATEPVDLELVLLADTTGSIDEAEVRFQRQGYAAALTDPAVLAAIGEGYHRRIAVTFVEWGDAQSQAVVVPWTVIDGADSAAGFARALLAAPRRAHGPNAIGSALAVAHGLIDGNAYDGLRKVIDLSGDSANSWGGVPVPAARAAALAAGITINGLAILCRGCNGRPVAYDLEQAYAETIIGGPGSFVITADDMERFAEAVRRKLLLEIAGGPSAARLATAR